MNEIVLEGCRTTPLAHYLKALGVLRLVAEQKDPRARGYWKRDHFVLTCEIDEAELVRFFLDEYRPTPVTGPWNGGSGYFAKDNTKAIDALISSTCERFGSYRETITAAKQVLTRLGLTEKPSSDQKELLLRACRGTFPDDALKWIDATFVLSDDGAKYPPLLGTGGNDGRLEFTNNFMQRLVSLFDPATGTPDPTTMGLLRASLFAEPTTDLAKGAPIGQFLPGNAGGVNASAGFAADSLINSWDFVLMLEGATLFATALARCLEQDMVGVLAYPFTVRAAGVGYESAASADEASARAETWMPVWEKAASLAELTALFSEGRARVGGRAARTGVDFARAVAGLGVDRGIDGFQRFGFHVRNGLSYFAVPIGRFQVHAEPRTELLHEIDSWMDRFRSKANGTTAPASAARALRQLESSIFDLCRRGDVHRHQDVLIALGRCEQAMVTSERWTTDSFLHPIPGLSGQWFTDCDDGSAEYRLAASLASVWGAYGSVAGRPRTMSLRQQFEPVTTWRSERGLVVRWNREADRDVVWVPGHATGGLNAVMQRRLMRAVQAGAETYPDRGHLPAELADISAFLRGEIDEQRFVDLLWGCLLIDWGRAPQLEREGRRGRVDALGAFYALLKLCFFGPRPGHTTSTDPRMGEIPIQPRIHRAAASGDATGACAEAIRRLRGSGLDPALRQVHVSSDLARRAGAALLFPIHGSDRTRLESFVLRRPVRDQEAISSNALKQGSTP